MTTCDLCHAEQLPERSRFCLECGAPLPEAESPAPYTPDHLRRDVLTSRSAREGERKEVTVLFADLADSLAMAESLDPEDIHTVMDGFFGLALEAVHTHGGTINQFRGDGFMALFGAPRTAGDDAARALRAALTIRDEVATYGRWVESEHDIPLVLRMGLNTGTVWVGSIGSNLRTDYTAEGPTVGLAARLERSAAPGQILVAEETAERARSFFELRELGVRAFRGISRPVRVFELMRAGPFRDRFEAERAIGPTAFVGREAELGWLEEIRSLVLQGETRGVDIRGEAGIGKSRLVFECARRSRPRMSVLEARCFETDATRAYTPWLDLLRRWQAELGGAEGAERLAREFGGETSEVAGTLQQFIGAFTSILRVASEQRPLVLVVEDLHWMDASSRQVLEALLQRGVGRALLMTTMRSELAVEVWSGGAKVDRLDLGPFEPEESRALGRTILGGLDDVEDLVDLAVHRGGGNPLFIEEVARTLREGPEDTRRIAQMETEILSSRSRVPTTLSGVIGARIDGLPDRAKQLLLALSVIDFSFDLELARALVPDLEDLAGQLVGDLERRGLLHRTLSSGFDFQHVLVREAAYAQLLHSRRRALHYRCAVVLADRGAAGTPDGASRVGFHYDRGGAGAQAADYLTAAGKAYLKVSALPEAAAHLRRAWQLHQTELTPDPGARASVGLALTSALNGLDRAGEASEVLESLQREDLESTDQRRLARACIEGGWIRFNQDNDIPGGRDLIQRGLSMTERLPEGRRVAMAGYAYLSRLNEQDAELGRSVAAAERLMELAEEAGDRFFKLAALVDKASPLLHRGEVETAVSACLEAASIADTSENEVAVATAYAFLSQALVYHGEPMKALDASERARSSAERTQQVGALFHAVANCGHAYLLLGDADRALREYEALAAINDRWFSAFAYRAVGLLEVGRHADAVEVAHDCLALNPPRLVRARTLCTYGLALGLADPLDRDNALAAIRGSLELCERQGLRPHIAEAKLALARLLGRWGEDGRAHAAAREAVEIFEACQMEMHAARARESLGIQ